MVGWNIGEYLCNETIAGIKCQVTKSVIPNSGENWRIVRKTLEKCCTVAVTPCSAAHLPIKSFWEEIKLKYSPH